MPVWILRSLLHVNYAGPGFIHLLKTPGNWKLDQALGTPGNLSPLWVYNPAGHIANDCWVSLTKNGLSKVVPIVCKD